MKIKSKKHYLKFIAYFIASSMVIGLSACNNNQTSTLQQAMESEEDSVATEDSNTEEDVYAELEDISDSNDERAKVTRKYQVLENDLQLKIASKIYFFTDSDRAGDKWYELYKEYKNSIKLDSNGKRYYTQSNQLHFDLTLSNNNTAIDTLKINDCPFLKIKISGQIGYADPLYSKDNAFWVFVVEDNNGEKGVIKVEGQAYNS